MPKKLSIITMLVKYGSGEELKKRTKCVCIYIYINISIGVFLLEKQN